MFLKKPVFSIFFIITFLTGCFNNEPSKMVYEDYFRKTVNSYDFFNDYFDIASLTRKNGWKDQDDYKISGEVKLKSKVSYLDLVSESVDALDKERKDNPLIGLGLGLTTMLRGMNGSNKEFRDFWQEEFNNNAIPKALLARQSSMKSDEFNALIHQADNSLIEGFGAVINRSLKPGDELIRTYTLTFKKTENGWMGFGAS